MPENPLTDAMRRQLTPTENAESISLPQTCCTTEVQQRLLVDLLAVLPERTQEGGRITRIGTSGVLRLLEAVPGSPWRGLSPHKLARMLGSFDVHPRAIRFRNYGVLRGYDYDELRSAFLTRLPPCDNPGLMRGPSV